MRFQYDGDWVESGVPLGADLPLEHGVLRPRLGKSAFGFLEDRAISAPVFSIFNDPAAPLSGLPEGAGRLETTALLLPHRTDSLGALSVTPVDVDPLPERPRVKRQSELPELIYAYHAMERGKAGSDEVSLLQNGLTLPGRRPVFTVERHREAQTARLRSMLDPIDRPLWMHMALVAANRCGICTVETDLEHEMGENILFTRRADRRGANADAPADKPLLTLTGATLAARQESPRPVPPGYLALADILNGGGAAPRTSPRCGGASPFSSSRAARATRSTAGSSTGSRSAGASRPPTRSSGIPRPRAGASRWTAAGGSPARTTPFPTPATSGSP